MSHAEAPVTATRVLPSRARAVVIGGGGALAAGGDPAGLLLRHPPAGLGADDALSPGGPRPGSGGRRCRRPDLLLRAGEFHARPRATAGGNVGGGAPPRADLVAPAPRRARRDRH